MRAYIKCLQAVSRFSLTRLWSAFLKTMVAAPWNRWSCRQTIRKDDGLLGHQVCQRHRVLGGGVAEGALADLLRVIVGLLDDATVLDYSGLERLGLDQPIRIGLPDDLVGAPNRFRWGPLAHRLETRRHYRILARC